MIKIWLDKLLGKNRAQVHVRPAATHIEKVHSGSGGVSVGVAKDGSQIIVNNLGVSDNVTRMLSQRSNLPEDRAEHVTRQFLNYIEGYYRLLPFKGMGNTAHLSLEFPLVELFVPLNARLALPEADTLAEKEKLNIAGRELSNEELENLGGYLDKLRPILDLVREYPVLVILGDPGSGKSTVMKFFALMLATGQAKPFALDGYLPLLLPLAAYSEKLDDNPSLSLRRFAVEYFQDHVEINDLDILLESQLKQGRVLILLDGLDEIKDIGQRNLVVERVQTFLVRHIDSEKPESGNRVVMTSRIIGYREVRPPKIAKLMECTLLDFEDEEIEQFVIRWIQIHERLINENTQIADFEAEREITELLESIQVHPGVRKLASNPLLLTMLVIHKRRNVLLPRHRVKLYEQYIESLLGSWLLARQLQGKPRNLPNDVKLRKTLTPLAFWMQESEPGKGLVHEDDLMRWLRSHFLYREDPDGSALKFIRDVREHSGLLIDRGGRRFGFLHLTFMEYLAGAYMVESSENGIKQMLEQIINHAQEGEWRETLLLAIGYLGLQQGRYKEATSLMMQLLEVRAEQSNIYYELVAAALADVGEDGVTPEGWYLLRQNLINEGLRGQRFSAVQRSSIGAYIALFGDPRDGVMDVDMMQFCNIPGGRFFLGSTNVDELARKNEKKGAGDYNLSYAYWLSYFPVTVEQYRQFVEDDTSYEPENDLCLKGLNNSPVVYVSWNEAMKFCRWLENRWHQQGWLPENYRVTLPSEPEWEKAAKGAYEIPCQPSYKAISGLKAVSADGGCKMEINEFPLRKYPWGDNDNRENIPFNHYISRAFTVGIYPGNQSPYGCEDMTGNVWEWTRSKRSPYPYPVDANGISEREEYTSDSTDRMVRGGALNRYGEEVERCSLRRSYHQNDDYYDVGFRIAVSPLL